MRTLQKVHHITIVKQKFKSWWLLIPPISIKGTINSHLNRTCVHGVAPLVTPQNCKYSDNFNRETICTYCNKRGLKHTHYFIVILHNWDPLWKFSNYEKNNVTMDIWNETRVEFHQKYIIDYNSTCFVNQMIFASAMIKCPYQTVLEIIKQIKYIVIYLNWRNSGFFVDSV